MSGRYSFPIRSALFAVATLVAAVGVSGPAHAQLGSIIIVDTTADTVAADGHCSLREAILAANGNSIADTCGPGTGNDGIFFNLGPGNPQINITSALPNITAPVSINGGTGGATRVVLHGPGTGSGVNGLFVTSTAPGTDIRNLVLNNFGGDAIDVVATGVTIAGNYIGTDADGASPMGNNGYGIFTQGSGLVVGGTTGATPGGPCTGDCNVIAYNSVAGVGNFITADSIRANSIHDNGSFGGIYNFGATAAPTITAAGSSISGTAPCFNCTIDVYADAAGEGKTWLGGTTSDGGGAWSLGIPALGTHITATYIGSITSQFSAPFTCPDADGDGMCNSADNCTLVANSNQRDTDGDGYGNMCDADFDNNGTVNINDLNRLKARLNISPVVDLDADLDGNGAVNINDLNRLKSFLGKPPGPSGLHPNCPPTCP